MDKFRCMIQKGPIFVKRKEGGEGVLKNVSFMYIVYTIIYILIQLHEIFVGFEKIDVLKVR